MIRNGKEVEEIKVTNKTKDGEVVVIISENAISCTNGYEVEVKYKNVEVCSK